MDQNENFELLHKQYEPMIYHIINKLTIYRNKQEFYQIGCIALWEASIRFDKDKGEFKSYAYSYIIGRMKSELTSDRKHQLNTYHLDLANLEKMTEDDFTFLLTSSIIDQLSIILTKNQRKWLKGYCLFGKTPTDLAKDEGVSISAVKAWRRDTISKLQRFSFNDLIG